MPFVDVCYGCFGVSRRNLANPVVKLALCSYCMLLLYAATVCCYSVAYPVETWTAYAIVTWGALVPDVMLFVDVCYRCVWRMP
eukprot:2699376-Rhodomonas_salina.2